MSSVVVRVFFVCVLSITLLSCSDGFKPHDSEPANDLNKIACPQNYEFMLDYFGSLFKSDQASLNSVTQQDFESGIKDQLVFDGFTLEFFKDSAYKIFNEFSNDLYYLSLVETDHSQIELLGLLKVEDTDTPGRKNMVEKYRDKISKLGQQMEQMGVQCFEKTPNKDDNTPDTNKPDPNVDSENQTPRTKTTQLLIESMKRTFATTYQSCSVLQQPELTEDTPSVEGIKEECCHESGRGYKRYISSLASVQKSHPYLRNQYGSACVKVNQNPLIYDFGGRPFFTRGSKGTLNFFKNWGGTSALGYDCSALVYAVLMRAGLRLKKNKPFVASDVVAAYSTQFLDPDSKNWSCLKFLDYSKEESDDLLPGDIASMDGHTVLIYSVGSDPLGINSTSSCNSISTSNFNFSILQSSPSKDGVGVNRYDGNDYLKTNQEMKQGFLNYARDLCRSKKSNKFSKIRYDNFSILRVSTDSQCRMPQVKFENESCVESCL